MKTLWRSLRLLLAFTALTGGVYPLLVGAAAALLPHPAPAQLLGGAFSAPGEFWSRPSAGPSTGSNLGPTNPKLIEQVAARVKALRDAEPDGGPIPVDLVTTSGSGLDPDISVAAALYQVPRVARARRIERTRVEALIAEQTTPRLLGLFGEPRVNVARLNLALGALSQ